MRRSRAQTLIHNKLFLTILILGILCLLASISLFLVMLTHLDSCIPFNACTEESSGYYSFCVKDGFKYCCGGWGTDTQSCGKFIGNCRKKNDGFIQCGGVFEAEVVLNFLVLGLFLLLVVIACLHRKQNLSNESSILLQSQRQVRE